MKNRLLHPLLLLLLVVTVLSGCKDDEVTPSKTDLLTRSTWTGASVWFQGSDATADYMQITGEDFTKTTIKYERAGTYVQSYEGSNYSGTWEFTNNETVVLMDKGTPDEQTGTVNKLDANEFILVATNGIEFRFRR